MARVTVEDCLDHVENRFELVMLATKRARQLATGGKEPLVKEDSDKPTVVSLREIAEGHVTTDLLNAPTVEDQFEDEFEAIEEVADEGDAAEAEAAGEGEEGTAEASKEETEVDGEAAEKED